MTLTTAARFQESTEATERGAARQCITAPEARQVNPNKARLRRLPDYPEILAKKRVVPAEGVEPT
jgi:hypothetical protein